MSGTSEKPRILLADDSPLNRKLAAKMLEHCGCEVDSAEDGTCAVEKACSSRYDLIQMDMFMPGLNGGDASIEIARKDVDTPIVALSGDIVSHDELARTGIKDFIQKPLLESELRRVIETWCGKGEMKANAPPPPNPPAQGSIYDEKAALELAGGNRDLLKEMLSLFQLSTANGIVNLSSCISAGDTLKVKSASHLIKGEAKSIGALKIAGIAGEINDAAKAGDMPGCAPRIHALEDAFKEFSGIAGGSAR